MRIYHGKYRLSDLASVILFIWLMFACMNVQWIAAHEIDDTTCNCRHEASFRNISNYISLGRVKLALQELDTIIEKYPQCQNDVKLAYMYKVYVYDQRSEFMNAMQTASKAVERFPEISVARVLDKIPGAIDEYFDEQRKLQYSTLRITSDPPGCRVLRNSVYVGNTPLDEHYVKVGEYKIQLQKNGYHDKIDSVAVLPLRSRERYYELDKKRNWLLIGGSVAMVSFVTYVLIHEVTREDPLEPFGSPPDPPAIQTQ